MKKPRMSEMKRVCLEALMTLTQPDGELCMPFIDIQLMTNLPRTDVRRSVRSLARQGYAEFHFPLSDEDGNPKGAGYCISRQGIEVVKQFTESVS